MAIALTFLSFISKVMAMSKEYLILPALLSFLNFGYSQSGVGMVAPDETLHVGGNNTATVRIDGLNTANNPNNLGGTDLYPIFTDAIGNIALNDQSNLLLSQGAISTPISVATQANSSLNTADLFQQNFTLASRALVVITYCIGIEFKNIDGTSNINDGRVKVAQNYFYLGDGTTEDPSKAYGQSSCTYSNFYCDTATGYVYNSNSIIVTLEAGTHSIHMKGAAFGGGLSSDAAFRAIFTDLDRIDISAIYL